MEKFWFLQSSSSLFLFGKFVVSFLFVVLILDFAHCRSYKTGFVWHDLCEDDLIQPASGNEYVLKGSELVEESSSGKRMVSTIYLNQFEVDSWVMFCCKLHLGACVMRNFRAMYD